MYSLFTRTNLRERSKSIKKHVDHLEDDFFFKLISVIYVTPWLH
jgi:hypothetical protein